MSDAIPLLLEPDELEALLKIRDDLLIIDLSAAENYAAHHIPGAVHLPFKLLQAGTPPAPGKLPAKEALEAVFSQIGLTTDKHVIAYDDEGGGWAGRLLWTLDVLDHTKYSYLNGGLVAWVNEGYPTSTAEKKITPGSYHATFDPKPVADLDDVLSNYQKTDTVIWDARSAAEYDGSKVVAKRGGHIPGAVHLDWLDLMDRTRNLRFKPLEELQAQLNQLGITKDKTVITHCHSHHRSGLSYLLMKILGYPNIKAYHGSWGEWGNREDTPVKTGSEP
jgi:thiosulfate/3-mercaptopyruvate sulfurtransferase